MGLFGRLDLLDWLRSRRLRAHLLVECALRAHLCVAHSFRTLGDHNEFLKRITKSLYYGQLPRLPCLSFPVTEISAELFSEAQRGRSLKRLHVDAAAEVTRSACVSPCSLVLAILYLERLKTCNPEYLAKVAPSELFLVSLMVSNKFLQDDGEEDEVFCDEWATSGGLDNSSLKHLERNFLNAIDWRIFVSEQSFEAGLSWLERQVALKQANLRGFFTYADLAAAAGDLCVGDLIRSFSSVFLAISLGYITSLLTVVTSTLLISHSLLPTLQHSMSATRSPAAVDINNNIITPLHTSDVTDHGTTNITIDDTVLADVLCDMDKTYTTQSEMNKVMCCERWSRACERASTQTRAPWSDSVMLNLLKPPVAESWLWRPSAGNWLYHPSLLSPLHKWLDKLEQISNFIKVEIVNYTLQPHAACPYHVNTPGAYSDEGDKCINSWLNLRKFSGFMVSISDR